MFSHEDPSIIWIAPHGNGSGRGTFDEPFTNVTQAIASARPGNTVVILGGRYQGDVTVQNSGTIDRPIRITAESARTVEFSGSCWYFYDVCDVILSGIGFRGTLHGAVSVVGACERNCFESLHFAACGTAKNASCTMFFGGSGARCNVVENCVFEATTPGDAAGDHDPRQSIGLLISEGDTEDRRMLNRDHVLRGNTFANYGCGVLIGSRGIAGRQYGHIVENNTIRNCLGDGIRVKCGDIILRGNVFERCGGSAVSLSLGRGCTVEDNRIEDCPTGIRVLGPGHTLRNNCILRSCGQSVHVSSGGEEGAAPASNVIIESNTCVHGSAAETRAGAVGIRVDTGTSCVIRRNLFCGPGRAYVVGDEKSESLPRTSLLVDDNLACGGCGPASGCERDDISFTDASVDNYENESGYGAQGWMVRGKRIEPAVADAERRPGAGMEVLVDDESMAEELVGEMDRRELLARSYFFEPPGAAGEPADDRVADDDE